MVYSSYGSPVSGPTSPTYQRPSKKNKTPVTDIYSENLNYGKYSSGNTGGGSGGSGTGGGGGGGGSSTPVVTTSTTARYTGGEFGAFSGNLSGGVTNTSTPGASYTYQPTYGPTITTTSPTARVLTPEGFQSIINVGKITGGGTSSTGVTLPSGGFLPAGASVKEGGRGPGGSLMYPVTDADRVRDITSETKVSAGNEALKEANTLTQASAKLSADLLATPGGFKTNTLYPSKEKVSTVSPQVANLFRTGVPIDKQQSFLPTSITPKIIQSPTQLRDDYLTGGSPDTRTLADFKLDTNYVPSILQKDLKGQYKENIQATTPTEVKREFTTSMPVITSPEITTYKEVKTSVPIDLSKLSNWQEIPIGYEKTTSRLPTVWEALKGVGTNVINLVPPVAVFTSYEQSKKGDYTPPFLSGMKDIFGQTKTETVVGEPTFRVGSTDINIPFTNIKIGDSPYTIPFATKEISFQEAQNMVNAGQPLRVPLGWKEMIGGAQNIFAPLTPVSQVADYNVNTDATKKYLEMTGTTREQGAPKSMFLSPAVLTAQSYFDRLQGKTAESDVKLQQAINLALGKDSDTGKINLWESSYNPIATINRANKGMTYLAEQELLGNIEKTSKNLEAQRKLQTFYKDVLNAPGGVTQDFGKKYEDIVATTNDATKLFNTKVETYREKQAIIEAEKADLESAGNAYTNYLEKNAKKDEKGNYVFGPNDEAKFAAAEAMRVMLEPKYDKLKKSVDLLNQEKAVLDIEQTGIDKNINMSKELTKSFKDWRGSANTAFYTTQDYATPYEQQLRYADKAKPGEGFLGLSGEQWGVAGSKIGTQVVQTMGDTYMLANLPMGKGQFAASYPAKETGAFASMGRTINAVTANVGRAIPGSAPYITKTTGLGFTALAGAGVYGRGMQSAGEFSRAGQYKITDTGVEYKGIANLPSWAKAIGMSEEQYNKVLGGVIGSAGGAYEMYKAAGVATKGEFSFVKGAQMEYAPGKKARLEYLDFKPWAEVTQSPGSKKILFSYTPEGGFGLGASAIRSPNVVIPPGFLAQGTSEGPAIFSKAFTDTQILAGTSKPLTQALSIAKTVRPQGKARVEGQTNVIDLETSPRINKLPDAWKDVVYGVAKEASRQTTGWQAIKNAWTGEGINQLGGSFVLKAKGLLEKSAIRANTGQGDIDVEMYSGAPKYAQKVYNQLQATQSQVPPGWKAKYNAYSGEIDIIPPGGKGAGHVINIIGPDTPGASLPFTPFGSIQKPSEIIDVKLPDGTTIPVRTKAAVDIFLDKVQAGMGGFEKAKGGKIEFKSTLDSQKSLGDLASMAQTWEAQGLLPKGTVTPEFIQQLSARVPGLDIAKGITAQRVIKAPGTSVTTSQLAGAGAATRYQISSETPSSISVTATTMPTSMSSGISKILGYSGTKPSGLKQSKASLTTKSMSGIGEINFPETLYASRAPRESTSTRSGFSSEVSSISSYTPSMESSLSSQSSSTLSSLSGSSISSIGSEPSGSSKSASESSVSSTSSISSLSSVSSLSGLGGFKFPTFGAFGGGVFLGGEGRGKRGRGSRSWLVENKLKDYAGEWFAKQKLKTPTGMTGVTGMTGSAYLKSIGKGVNTNLRGKL